MSLRLEFGRRGDGQRTAPELLVCAFVVLCLITYGPFLSAQAPVQESAPPAPVKTIPLQAGNCMAVAAGGTLSLDWNPGFDRESAVDGIDHFNLIFASVASDGVTIPTHPNGDYLRHNARSVTVTRTANGYYHIEVRVSLPPGNFRLVDAAIAPHRISGYDGPIPKMTNNPSRLPYCVTVIDPHRAKQQNSQ